nr:PREDICTED: uncharacterized protein LOC105672291 [Linepithema humile]
MVRECWWPPRTANCATLIANCAHPNSTGKRYDVDIIKYCTSLESARKNASDASYETTNEERLGREKRQHIPFNCCSTEEESEPCVNKTKNRLYSNAISTSSLYPDTLSLEYGYSNASVSNASMSNAFVSNASVSNAFVSNASVLNKSQSNAIPIISNASDYAMTATAQQGFENTNDLETDNNSNITEMLQQILRMLAVLNVLHKEVKQRLKKLEDVVKTSYPQRASNLHQDCKIMKEFLPFTTNDAVREFDKVLRTKKIAVQFRQFILKTGGNNPKDSIHQNLKKIFREITSQFSFTETEFDNITSIWFRFAKQRKERSDKTKEKEME